MSPITAITDDDDKDDDVEVEEGEISGSDEEKMVSWSMADEDDDLLGDCVIEYLPFKVICSGDQRIRRKLGKKCILYLGTYIGIIEYI